MKAHRLNVKRLVEDVEMIEERLARTGGNDWSI